MCSIVGVPFHVNEPLETFQFLLKNLDTALVPFHGTGEDVKIIIVVNGDGATSKNIRHAFISERLQRQHSADILLEFTEEKGKISALQQIIQWAKSQSVDTVFFTDAEIYRFPNALIRLFEQRGYTVAGSNLQAYPDRIVNQSHAMDDHERFWYQVFEGDKHPLIRERVNQVLGKQNRVRGGLLRVQLSAFDSSVWRANVNCDDSVLNQSVEARQIVPQSVCFYYGRTSLADHVAARTRYARDAAFSGRTETILECISGEQVDDILRHIQSLTVDNLTQEYIRSRFLLRSALRNEVSLFVFKLATGKSHVVQDFPEYHGYDFGTLLQLVTSFAVATKIIKKLFFDEQEELSKITLNGCFGKTTQAQRIPIDIGDLLPRGDGEHVSSLCHCLGVTREELLKL